jgi:hypothetical protein
MCCPMNGLIGDCPTTECLDHETYAAGKKSRTLLGITYVYYFMPVDLLLHQASVNSSFVLWT